MEKPSFMDMIKAAKNMQAQMSSAKSALNDARISGKSGDVEIIVNGLHQPVEVKGVDGKEEDIKKALMQINEEIQRLSQEQIKSMSGNMGLDELEDKDS